MKLSCLYWSKWIAPYATGLLDLQNPKLAAQVAHHVAGCAQCRAAVDSLTVVDTVLRTHARTQRINDRLDAPKRRASSMSERVVAAIRPDEKYSTPMWTPGTLSFVSVAAFALVVVTLVNPQSGARAWFLTSVLGQQAAPAQVTAPVTPPFPASNDPFKATIAPTVKQGLASPAAQVPGQSPQLSPSPFMGSVGSVPAPASLADTSPATAAATGPRHTSASTASFKPATSPTSASSAADAPTIDSQPAAAVETTDRQSPVAERSLPYDSNGTQAPPSPPGALTNAAGSLLQSDSVAQTDGPLAKRSLLKSLGDGSVRSDAHARIEIKSPLPAGKTSPADTNDTPAKGQQTAP